MLYLVCVLSYRFILKLIFSTWLAHLVHTLLSAAVGNRHQDIVVYGNVVKFVTRVKSQNYGVYM
jgi:hypothetical protein